MKKLMSFEEATRRYVHRFTMEHVPAWAAHPVKNGKYYAPQYASDKEWFESTVFPPSELCVNNDCYSSRPTWPCGKWLDKPFTK